MFSLSIWILILWDVPALSIDTRYMVIPKENKFTAIDEKQLLDADKACNFVGGIQKLENKHL